MREADAFGRVLGSGRGSDRRAAPRRPLTPLERARALVAWMESNAEEPDVVVWTRELAHRAAGLSLTVHLGTWKPTDVDDQARRYQLGAICDGDELVGFVCDTADGVCLLRHDQLGAAHPGCRPPGR